MRVVIQRVSRAHVVVEGRVTSEIGPGLVILVAVGGADTRATANSLAEKTAQLRIMDDDRGKMNRSLLDTGGAALVVSQFTLYGDARKGRRPAFDRAAPPELAKTIYEAFIAALRAQGVPVKTGNFRARMSVELENEGPVTVLLDSEKLF